MTEYVCYKLKIINMLEYVRPICIVCIHFVLGALILNICSRITAQGETTGMGNQKKTT